MVQSNNKSNSFVFATTVVASVILIFLSATNIIKSVTTNKGVGDRYHYDRKSTTSDFIAYQDALFLRSRAWMTPTLSSHLQSKSKALAAASKGKNREDQSYKDTIATNTTEANATTTRILQSSSGQNNLLSSLKDKRILAFGDSLTWGLVAENGYSGQRPYADKLGELLAPFHVSVIEKGENGEKTAHMVHRLAALLDSFEFGSGKAPALVLILAGTNDLGGHLTAHHILTRLIRLHRLSLSTPGVSGTIAMTIPNLEWPVNQSTRVEVNEGLRLFVRHCLQSEVIDLEKLWENKTLWSRDYVHFSRIGYDAIGEIIFQRISGSDNTTESVGSFNASTSAESACSLSTSAAIEPEQKMRIFNGDSATAELLLQSVRTGAHFYSSMCTCDI